jgi:hypothetical protein
VKIELTEKETLAFLDLYRTIVDALRKEGIELPAPPAPQEEFYSRPIGDPDPIPPAASSGFSFGSSVLPPPPENKVSPTNLPKLSDEVRSTAWAVFVDLVKTWATNFDQEGPQPDRLDKLRDVGSGRSAFAILVMAYEAKSLQRLVANALIGVVSGSKDYSLDYADKIASNMVQVSHMVFPDLSGTYDYSTKWRRG